MSRATSCGRHPAAVTRSSPGDRLEHLEPTEVGPQCLGHANASVLLLVGLEQRDDRAVGGAERAVEGGDRLDVIAEAGAGVEPAGLEVGAVGGRGQLAEAALARDPGLAVELALCREA